MAQEKTVTGILFDKATKERIAAVKITDTTNSRSWYNDLKGEFSITAGPGDVLLFSKDNYFTDTINVKSYAPLAIYMRAKAILLKQVDIHTEMMDPEKRLEATKEDYTKIYGSLGNRDLLSLPASGGAGISIDALYNLFSRSGRNAEHLRNIIQEDYYQNVIDYRFNREFVARVTGLKNDRLTDFMQKYRPGYYLVTTASEYDFIAYIKSNLKRYLRNPRIFTLPSLVPAK